MRLADYLEQHPEQVLAEWIAFARKQSGAANMDLVALRDHAAEMLTEIVADLRTAQTVEQQHTKAHGEAVRAPNAGVTSAEAHGADRAGSGFSVSEMLAEFRALRASVVRLWTAHRGTLTGVDLDDLARFHEAIDQAIAESITRFQTSLTQAQDLFVAILGHDLRTPLQTVTLVTEHVAESDVLDAGNASMMRRAVRSARRMVGMLDDLVDFTRSRAGTGLSVTRAEVDLQRIVEEAVDEFRSTNPQHDFVIETEGDLRGHFDGSRMHQVLANLLGNAVQHGTPMKPVKVAARGEGDQIVVEICNDGPPIAETERPRLFDPFKRLKRGTTVDVPHNLGLGLYIVQQIVAAHGGRIEVTSTDADGTCFEVQLPRRDGRDNGPAVFDDMRVSA